MDFELPGALTISLSTPFIILVVILCLIAFGSLRRFRQKRVARSEEHDTVKERIRQGLDLTGGPLKRVTVRNLKKDKTNQNIVAVLNVFGPILDDPGVASPLLRSYATFGENVREILMQLRGEVRVKGVIIRFNTPGGTVSGSEAIREGIEECNKVKPVYAHVGGISASGGVWAMTAARKIIAGRESMVGSIGVIGPTLFSYKGVKEIGQGLFGTTVEAGEIGADVLFAGKGKTLGNPFAPRDEDVIQRFNNLLNRTYLRFVDTVLCGRPKATREMLTEIGAAILDASEAIKVGLIDDIGSRRDAEQSLLNELKLAYEDTAFVLIHKPVREQFSSFFVQASEYLPGGILRRQEALVAALHSETGLLVAPFAMQKLI